jgi:WNK lysine deficient protein kinase
VIFITRIVNGGSLLPYIKKNDIRRLSIIKKWCVQILNGLDYLHARKIIHRDIKCENIFIDSSSGEIQIGDLGLATPMAREY